MGPVHRPTINGNVRASNGANGRRMLQRKGRIENIHTALHTGWLWKKGKLRWFVLRGATLYWFVEEYPANELSLDFLQKRTLSWSSWSVPFFVFSVFFFIRLLQFIGIIQLCVV